MSKDLITRLMGGRRSGLISHYRNLGEKSELTSRELREARLVARVMLSDSDWCDRSDAAELLGEVGNATDVYALKVACVDEEWAVRCSAYSALATVGKKRQFRFLRDCALSEDMPVPRRWAYVAAFDADEERAVLWLAERWSAEKDELAEVGLVGCLAQKGNEAAIHRLREFAASDDHPCFLLARQCLAELGLG